MILFRCDSSFEIGTGHVARCLKLAHLFKGLGQDCSFLIRDLPGNLQGPITNEGFPCQVISATDDDFARVREIQPRWIVIDHYQINHEWERQASQFAKIFVIDDLLRKHDCQILLDQNFRVRYDGYENKIPANCQVLLGPRYCILDSQLEAKDLSQSSLPPIQNILVFFGGADSRNDLSNFYESLKQAGHLGHLQFHLVALKSHQHLEQLKNLPQIPNLQFHFQPENWPELLRSADFYIGSGGTVTWERLFVGIPGAVISVADNQISVSQEMAQQGLQYYWGDSRQMDWSKISVQIENCLQKRREIFEMARKGQILVQRLDLKVLAGLSKDFCL